MWTSWLLSSKNFSKIPILIYVSIYILLEYSHVTRKTWNINLQTNKNRNIKGWIKCFNVPFTRGWISRDLKKLSQFLQWINKINFEEFQGTKDWRNTLSNFYHYILPLNSRNSTVPLWFIFDWKILKYTIISCQISKEE